MNRFDMSIDRETLETFKARLIDRYTAVELCEMLGITEEELLEAFEEKVMELRLDQ